MIRQELWTYGAIQEELILSSSSASQFFQFINKTISEVGIRIHRQSRLKRYEQITKKKLNYSTLSRDELFELSISYTELAQLAVIAYTGLLKSVDQEYKKKVKLLLLDAANPIAKEKNETRGRDTQFEIFIASCWKPIGFSCKLSPPPLPDIELSIDGYEFGIEAKRLKSLTGMGRRLRKAKKQLKKSNDGGIIAMDVSPILARRQYGFSAQSMQQARSDLERRLYAFMKDNQICAIQNGQSKKSFAWFCFAQALYAVEDIGLICTYQWKNMNLCDGNDRRWLTITKHFPKLVLVTERAFKEIGAINFAQTMP